MPVWKVLGEWSKKKKDCYRDFHNSWHFPRNLFSFLSPFLQVLKCPLLSEESRELSQNFRNKMFLSFLLSVPKIDPTRFVFRSKFRIKSKYESFQNPGKIWHEVVVLFYFDFCWFVPLNLWRQWVKRFFPLFDVKVIIVRLILKQVWTSFLVARSRKKWSKIWSVWIKEIPLKRNCPIRNKKRQKPL